MNIALISSDRGPCPPVRGGAIQLLISRVAPLLAKRHQVTIYSIRDPALNDYEQVDGVEYIRFPLDTFFSDVCRHMQTRSFDIIQTYNRPAWISVLRSLFPRTKLVLSLHNSLNSQDQESFHLEDADLILTVSQYLANQVTINHPSVQSKVVPLNTGVELKEYATVWSKQGKQWRKRMRKQYGIEKEAPVLLFVGRLVTYKGCHQLVKAMKRITRNVPKATLVVVGSKWYADESVDKYIKNLKKRADKLRGRVIFTSYIPVSMIPQVFASADIFICASQWQEPLARVHYEAMAAGLPIITTNRGGNAEVMIEGRTGYVIDDYDNAKAFSKAILALLQNPKKQKRMGRFNRRLAEEKYNFSRVARDLDHFYHGLYSREKK